MIIIRHPAFPDWKVSLPFDWNSDPYKSKNWRHHVCSLRWLRGVKDERKVFLILKDFYDFHIIRKRKNPYYSDLRGDHTISIRIHELIFNLDRFIYSRDVDAEELCMGLIKEELNNITDDKNYRSGHNHGLMMDIALLKFYLRFNSSFTNIDLPNIINRAWSTLNEMFNKDGYTREHSISYQVYNCAICCDLIEVMSLLDNDPNSDFRKFCGKIVEATKNIIKFSTRKNGEIFAIGDSHRLLDSKDTLKIENLSNRLNISNSSLEELNYNKTLSDINSEYFLESSCGFTVYNNIKEEIHLFFTCGMYSGNHKQNDELSFCLDLNGAPVIEDPGFAGYASWDKLVSFNSEARHSTFSLAGHSWNSPQYSASPVSRIVSTNNTGEVLCVTGEHKRIAGHTLRRRISINKNNNIINILDSVIEENSRFVGLTEHRFVLHPEAEWSALADGGLIAIHGNPLVELKILSESPYKWDAETIDYVSRDRKSILSTTMVVCRVEHTLQSCRTDALFCMDLRPKLVKTDYQ